MNERKITWYVVYIYDYNGECTVPVYRTDCITDADFHVRMYNMLGLESVFAIDEE